MKRIIVAGLHHESNTFSPIITTEKDFTIYRGGEILDALNSQDSISGIIRTFQEAGGYELFPILMARAVPNGVVEGRLYQALKDELLTGMEKIDSVDALTLSLHGSMRVEEIGEAEGDFLRAVRKLFPDIPIVASLDMHATVTPAMLENCDAFVGYKQAPHTDCFETGAHAARLTMKTLEDGCRLSTVCCRIPLLIAGEKTETSTEPMAGMIEELREQEKREGILAASFLLGFPWADSEENGVCALVVSEDDEELARSTAFRLAEGFWAKRTSFQFHTTSLEPDSALRRALATEGRPVYLSDSGDNPTAGSSGDCTNFLARILENPEATSLDPPLLYAGIYDPEAVASALNGVASSSLKLKIGASLDRKTSRPLLLGGQVTAVKEDYGPFGASLILFHSRGIDLILTDKHIGFTETDIFTALDIDYPRRKLIVVKLGYLTASHKKAAVASIMALSDGSSNEELTGLPYRHVKRPIYPLDPATEAEFLVF